MPDYKLSILIPAWNGEKYIKDCINSILDNDYQNFKIILIVGGTENDNSFDVAKKLEQKYLDKIKTLEQKVGNKNKALNLGFEKAEGDIIVLSDIDCLYQKNWLKRINEIFQNEKINVITSYILPFPSQNNSLAEFNNLMHGNNLVSCCESGNVIIGNKLCGANSMFRKEVFLEKIGKFDETIPTGEDKILGITFNKNREQIFYFSDIYVYSECYSTNLKMYIKHRIRWARDLFINPLTKMQILKLLFAFGISLFKLLYIFAVIPIWLLFFNYSYIWLLVLLSPYIIFFLLYQIKFYFKLKRINNFVNLKLNSNFSHKKAFKIVPILFFAYAIITIISLIYPKRSKW